MKQWFLVQLFYGKLLHNDNNSKENVIQGSKEQNVFWQNQNFEFFFNILLFWRLTFDTVGIVKATTTNRLLDINIFQKKTTFLFFHSK